MTWISDLFRQAAISAVAVPDGVRIETKRAGKERTMIVLPYDEARALVSEILAATGDRCSEKDNSDV